MRCHEQFQGRLPYLIAPRQALAESQRDRADLALVTWALQGLEAGGESRNSKKSRTQFYNLWLSTAWSAGIEGTLESFCAAALGWGH